MIKGVTFDMQSPTAKNHGALFRGILSDGTLDGCAVTVSGKNCYISAGYMIAAGRLIQLTATEIIPVPLNSGDCTVVLHIDLSRAATTDTFAQAYFSVVSGAAPDLTQQDINGNGTLYEIPVAVLGAAASSLTIKSSIGKAHGKMIADVYSDIPDDLSKFVEGEVILVG